MIVNNSLSVCFSQPSCLRQTSCRIVIIIVANQNVNIANHKDSKISEVIAATYHSSILTFVDSSTTFRGPIVEIKGPRNTFQFSVLHIILHNKNYNIRAVTNLLSLHFVQDLAVVKLR